MPDRHPPSRPHPNHPTRRSDKFVTQTLTTGSPYQLGSQRKDRIVDDGACRPALEALAPITGSVEACDRSDFLVMIANGDGTITLASEEIWAAAEVNQQLAKLDVRARALRADAGCRGVVEEVD